MERKGTVFTAVVVSLLCLLYLLTGTAGVAQIGDSDASSLVRRSSAAMGCNLLGKDTAISVRGLLRASSVAAPMPIQIGSLGNDRWRSELDTPKEHKVTIVNSGKGQIQHGDGHVTALAEHNTSYQRPMHIPCLTNISLPSGQIEATLLRTESAEAEIFDVVELQLSSRPKEKREADRMKTTVWISRTTGYLGRLKYVNAAEQDSNDTQDVEIEYTDYRLIDGLAVPFHQITRSGQLTLDLQLNSVQLNASAADFNLR